MPTGTCHSYRLVGAEALSEELVAQHYTINPRLDAVIVVDKTIPTFEYHTYYSTGSADEAEGQQGRIHFLEHIMAGTGSHGPGKLNEIIVDNGGQNYAATTIHHMYLRMRFPKDKFDLAVEIDRDRYYGTLVNEEVVENEKKIVLTEKSRNSANSNKKFSNRFWGLVYKKKNFSGVGTE
ncbi:MAG: insulinase family protein, partial [Gemmatimonadota bacterium]|nr:insulinase family protein [Gemmatimonadota bacterium]